MDRVAPDKQRPLSLFPHVKFERYLGEAKMETKICTGCGVEKEVSEFYKDKHRKSGLMSICKTCHSNNRKIKYKETKKELKENGYLKITEKKCSICGVIKQTSDFFVDSGSKDGFNKSCRQCISEYKKSKKDYYKEYGVKYRIKNKDKISDKNKNFYAINKDEINEKAREKYKENKVAVSNKQKVYYRENWDAIREKAKIRDSSPAPFGTFAHKLTIEEESIVGESGLLMCRCSKCREYFCPSYSSVINRILSLDGKQQGECRLYCSDNCKASCTIFNTKWLPRVLTKANLRCHQNTNRKMLIQLQFDEYGYNFCEVYGEEMKASKLTLHHNHMVVFHPKEADNMAHQILVCKKHHTHEDCK